jgi:hypothetical protein
MTHTQALNLILANACPNDTDPATGAGVYVIQVCCETLTVRATFKGQDENGNATYDVHDVTVGAID